MKKKNSYKVYLFILDQGNKTKRFYLKRIKFQYKSINIVFNSV